MKKCLFISIIFISFLSYSALSAANKQIYMDLIDHIKNIYNESEGETFNILNFYQNKLLIEKNGDIQIGSELLIYNKVKDIPYYLTDPINVAIIRDKLKEGYVAECIKKMDKTKKSLIASYPVDPIIYISKKDAYDHSELINLLVKSGFIVNEIDKAERKKDIKNYGILLEINNYNGHIEFTTRSLYFGNILYRYHPTPKAKLTTKHKGVTPTIVKTDNSYTEDYRARKKIYKLPNDYYRFRIANIDNKDDEEFIFLSSNNLVIYKFEQGKFKFYTEYKFKDNNLVPVQLYTMDVNADNKEEIIFTTGREVEVFGFQDTEITSTILSYKKGSLSPISEKISYYLRVIENTKGEKILLGQKKGEYKPYEGDILLFSWDKNNNNKLINRGVYKQAKNIYSIYQFNFLPNNIDRVAILEPSNHIRVYDLITSKPVNTLEISFGDFNILPIKIKLKEIKYLGGFDRKITYKEFYAPRRYELKHNINNQIFTIRKSTTSQFFDFTKMSLKGEPKDNIVAVRFENNYLNIEWQSNDIYNEILDFAFSNIKDSPLLYILVKTLDGYGIMQIG
ncbi:MAG: hypothetical protein SVN78_03035 [Deferribacterota bacterium]|nr:hypothetical protein [Deferribacterota bacterium]